MNFVDIILLASVFVIMAAIVSVYLSGNKILYVTAQKSAREKVRKFFPLLTVLGLILLVVSLYLNHVNEQRKRTESYKSFVQEVNALDSLTRSLASSNMETKYVLAKQSESRAQITQLMEEDAREGRLFGNSGLSDSLDYLRIRIAQQMKAVELLDSLQRKR